MNDRIYSLKKNPRLFEQMNIFFNKYTNIFKYPNIGYTLVQKPFRCLHKTFIMLRYATHYLDSVGKMFSLLHKFLGPLAHNHQKDGSAKNWSNHQCKHPAHPCLVGCKKRGDLTYGDRLNSSGNDNNAFVWSHPMQCK